ncbi:MAG: hypothetical protein CTY24_12095 [Methylobacter sp.]|nr:MAG: hypothetical protein CTY24_12095 [Methylobacter sp.]
MNLFQFFTRHLKWCLIVVRFTKITEKPVLKKLYKVFAVLLAGFAGGAITPWGLGWLRSVQVSAPSDAISIANTYIVFTTIIFVGVTVILAIAGYVFTQQFSATKQSQESQLLDELKEKVKSDERIGIALANAILDNSDVKRHLDETLLSKVDELIQARLADSKAAANQATQEAGAIESLASQLKPNGE